MLGGWGWLARVFDVEDGGAEILLGHVWRDGDVVAAGDGAEGGEGFAE